MFSSQLYWSDAFITMQGISTFLWIFTGQCWPFFQKKVLLETAVFYEQSRESFPAFKANCYIMIEFIKVHLLQDNNSSLYLKPYCLFLQRHVTMSLWFDLSQPWFCLFKTQFLVSPGLLHPSYLSHSSLSLPSSLSLSHTPLTTRFARTKLSHVFIICFEFRNSQCHIPKIKMYVNTITELTKVNVVLPHTLVSFFFM